jgi:hypothetical protein
LLPLSHSGIGSILQSFFVTAVLLVAQPWVIYRVLKRWQERIERNEPVWFNGMSMWNVALVSAGMATLWMTASYLSDFFPGGIDDGYPMFFVTLSLGGNFIIQVALWFWWCDRPPRVAVDRAIVALLAIMMFCALISVTFDAQSWIAKLYVMVMMIVPALVSILVGLGAYRLALKFWAKEKDTQATSM